MRIDPVCKRAGVLAREGGFLVQGEVIGGQVAVVRAEVVGEDRGVHHLRVVLSRLLFLGKRAGHRQRVPVTYIQGMESGRRLLGLSAQLDVQFPAFILQDEQDLLRILYTGKDGPDGVLRALRPRQELRDGMPPLPEGGRHPQRAKANDQGFERTPTGKTGVAFGLLDCRRGGHDVLIVNRQKSSEGNQEAPFRYYLGYDDGMDCLHITIGQDVGYNEWALFDCATDDIFEIYYSSEPRALNNDMSIFEASNCHCVIEFNEGVEPDGNIYIRKIDPQTIEYTVATEDGINRGELLAKISRCELE